ncbi:MAG: MaoC family dehydratase N-terminal domain-containing protein [Rhizobiaceae bacterium]|nr:MaoC family dehydratase N-terminal domain-containing protein [Rhizobiaceae bacterium]
MAIDPDALFSWKFPEITHTFTRRDTILYALGVGLGADPLDEAELQYVYEPRLVALPTYANVLAYGGFWLQDPATGADWRRVVHGEQAITILEPLPVEGTVVGRQRVTGLVDRGSDKGAMVTLEREVSDAATGRPLCRVVTSTIMRGDGGFGRALGEPPAQPRRAPDRTPDAVVERATLKQAALIYRLSGDYNPLHADPAVAAAAGFPRPILHGMGTMGVVGHAVVVAAAGGDPARVKQLSTRFSAPVFPGETLRTSIWDLGSGAFAFSAEAVERGVKVIANGHAEIG